MGISVSVNSKTSENREKSSVQITSLNIIDSLPEEMLDLIFSYFTDLNERAFLQVSKSWHHRGVRVIKLVFCRKVRTIANAIKDLIEHSKFLTNEQKTQLLDQEKLKKLCRYGYRNKKGKGKDGKIRDFLKKASLEEESCKFKLAQIIFSIPLNVDTPVSHLNTVVTGYFKDIWDQRELVNAEKNFKEKYDTPNYNIRLLINVVKLFLKFMYVEKAKKLVELIDNEECRSYYYFEIVKKQIEHGHIKGMKMMMKKLTKDYQDQAYGLYAEKMAKKNDIDGVIKAIEKIHNIQKKGYYVGLITHDWLNSSKISAVVLMLHRYFSILECYYKNIISRDLLNHYLDNQDIAGAKELAKNIKIKRNRDDVFFNIMENQLVLGDICGAKQTVSDITDSDTKNCALKLIADYQLRNYEMKEAMKTIEDISDIDQKNTWLLWARVNLFLVENLNSTMEVPTLIITDSNCYPYIEVNERIYVFLVSSMIYESLKMSWENLDQKNKELFFFKINVTSVDLFNDFAFWILEKILGKTIEQDKTLCKAEYYAQLKYIFKKFKFYNNETKENTTENFRLAIEALLNSKNTIVFSNLIEDILLTYPIRESIYRAIQKHFISIANGKKIENLRKNKKSWERDYIFFEIIEQFINLNCIEEAKETIKNDLVYQHHRDMALRSISERYLDNFDIRKAREVACEINHEKTKKDLLQKIIEEYRRKRKRYSHHFADWHDFR